MVKQLSVEQKKIAILNGKVPRNVINGPDREVARPVTPKGIAAKQMTEAQQKLLRNLISTYLGKFRAELADADWKKIEEAGFGEVYFAWAGEIQPGKPHYYRVQGPTFIFEYDNVQNNANHVHAVWRDFKNDFGEDLLKKHYQTVPHEWVLISTVYLTNGSELSTSTEYRAWSMEHGAWSMEHGAWSMEHGAWSMEHGAWSMEH